MSSTGGSARLLLLLALLECACAGATKAGVARAEPHPAALATNLPLAPWEPSRGHTQVPIWPSAAPDPEPLLGPENATELVRDKLVGGRPWTSVSSVSRPTMTVYSPTGPSTGTTVIVFPGGGYRILAMDLEGSEVCDWLTAKGVTCVLLKYRVPGEGSGEWQPIPSWGKYRTSRMALEDAQRTISLVRSRATEWRIDPHKIGALGFSAGGHLAVAVSTHFAHRAYSAVDAVDETSCRPDFAVVLYPGHLSEEPRVDELNPDVRVAADTPPTFLVQAEDDPVDPVANSLVYEAALRRAGAPVEMHLFAHGGHAFGLRSPPESPVHQWPALVETWLHALRR